jgi:hypothetical protein
MAQGLFKLREGVVAPYEETLKLSREQIKEVDLFFWYFYDWLISGKQWYWLHLHDYLDTSRIELVSAEVKDWDAERLYTYEWEGYRFKCYLPYKPEVNIEYLTLGVMNAFCLPAIHRTVGAGEQSYFIRLETDKYIQPNFDITLWSRRFLEWVHTFFVDGYATCLFVYCIPYPFRGLKASDKLIIIYYVPHYEEACKSSYFYFILIEEDVKMSGWIVPVSQTMSTDITGLQRYCETMVVKYEVFYELYYENMDLQRDVKEWLGSKKFGVINHLPEYDLKFDTGGDIITWFDAFLCWQENTKNMITSPVKFFMIENGVDGHIILDIIKVKDEKWFIKIVEKIKGIYEPGRLKVKGRGVYTKEGFEKMVKDFGLPKNISEFLLKKLYDFMREEVGIISDVWR